MMLLRYELRSVSLFTIFRLPVVATGHLNAHSLHGTVVGSPMAPGIPLVAALPSEIAAVVVREEYCRRWAIGGLVKSRVMFGCRGTLNCQS